MSEGKETPASLGREIGAMVRAGQAGESVNLSAIYETANRMLEAKGATAADALALLTMARSIGYGHPSRRWLTPWTMSEEEAFIMKVLDRTVQVLEAASGEHEAAFSGFDTHLN